jgi:predicted amidophosphoribosyltransferase
MPMNIFWQWSEMLNRARYQCPCCGRATVSFKKKISARRFNPQDCESCGERYIAKSFLLDSAYSIGMYLLFLLSLVGSFYSGRLWPIVLMLLVWPVAFLFYASKKKLYVLEKK